MSLTAAALALFSSLALSCTPSEAVADPPVEIEARRHLVEYVEVDTTNPPGNEVEGARVLAGILEREGIPFELVGPDPTRQSIVARLVSGTPEPALVLLHHVDVVPANRDEWARDPFDSETIDGYIWGRGTLDAKSLGIAHLASLLALKREGTELVRDVIFVGVADEERGGELGAEWLLENRPDLIEGAGWVLNEGGANEVIVDRVAFWGIEVDQKTPLWLTLTASGPRGHGAVPPDDGGAAVALIGVLADLIEAPRPYRASPTVSAYFSSLSGTKVGRRKDLLADIASAIDEPDFETELSDGYRSLLRTTIGLTTIAAGDAVNSIPATATATLDVRVVAGMSADETLARLTELVAGRATVEVNLIGRRAEPTSTDTEVFRALRSRLLEVEPGSVAGPLVSPGTTDCRFFRERNIACYGFSPFKVNYYDGDRVHGVDEKIRARFFDEGIRLMRVIVEDLAAAPLPASSSVAQ